MKHIPPGKQLSSLGETTWKEANQLEHQGTYFPRTIGLEDLDKAVHDWFTNGAGIFIEGTPLPVMYLAAEKWAEFKRDWKLMDSDHKVALPYITIRRSETNIPTDPIKSNIPGYKFTTYKLPVHTEAGSTYRYYKVPQPVRVELQYEVRALTNYMRDINAINEAILRHFASLQTYLDIDGHYMPMEISSTSDETDFDNLDDERIIHTLYSIKLKGYLIDEVEFEEKTGVARILVNIDEETS